MNLDLTSGDRAVISARVQVEERDRVLVDEKVSRPLVRIVASVVDSLCRYHLFLLISVLFIFLLISTFWAIVQDLADAPMKVGRLPRISFQPF